MSSITRVVTNQQATLTLTAYDEGTQTDLGTITIGIVDANGDTVVSSGTSVTDNGDGTYAYSLAAQSEPNLLTVTWTVAGGSVFTTFIEVIGSVLFNEAQLRTFDDDAITAADYSDADVLAMHDRVADYLESQTGRSWIRRYARCDLPGSGFRDQYLDDALFRTSAGLPLDRPGAKRDIIRLFTANDGSSITVGNVAILPNGRFHRTDAAWTSPPTSDPYNVTLEYEYGVPFAVDGVDRIAMMIARHWLVSSRIPGNAASFTDTLGSYSFDETRLPFEAYHWIKSHRVHAPFA